MLILLVLALVAADAEAKAAPRALEMSGVSLTASEKSWFRPGVRPFGSTARIAPDARTDQMLRSPSEAAAPATMNCVIRVLKADPNFDAEIARPAPPDLDPGIVRPSPCR